jgi:hypothetical protein
VLKTIDPAEIVSIETRRPIAARWVAYGYLKHKGSAIFR